MSEQKDKKRQEYICLLIQTSKLASRIGMKGTDFWPQRCEIGRKNALSSEARSCVVDAGYFAENSLRDANDCNAEAFGPRSYP